MVLLPVFPLVPKHVASIAPRVKHILGGVYEFGVGGTDAGSTMKGAGANDRARTLPWVPDVPSVVHLIEVNLTFGAVLIALFRHLRKLNVLPHVMRLYDPVGDGVHRL